MQDPHEGSQTQKSMLQSQQYISLCLQNTLYSGTLIRESHQEVTNYQAYQLEKQIVNYIPSTIVNKFCTYMN